MKWKSIYILSWLLWLLVILISMQCKSKGETVATDTTIFSWEFVERLKGAERMEKKVPMWHFSLDVEEGHQPRIDKIIKKYGKPDKITHEVWKLLQKPEPPLFISSSRPTPVIVYYYGRYAFAVRGDDKEMKVICVKKIIQKQ